MNINLLIYLLFIILVLFFITNRDSTYEPFINVMDAHKIYNRYRNYIDINYNISNKLVSKQCKRPPKISTNCYNDKLSKCMESRNNTCHYMAFNSCIIPIIN
mgnify:CR=1 FL=1